MTTYRLFPSTVPSSGNIDPYGYTLGTQFTVSVPCTLMRIWFYSPPGVTFLPSQCGIWDVLTQIEVPGSDVSPPHWSAPAGSGWVSTEMGGSGVVFNAGQVYKVAVYKITGPAWFIVTGSYWSSGPGAAGVTNGLISAPGDAAASPGQGSYSTSPDAWGYPDCPGLGANYWIDAEVDPSPVTTAPLPFSRGMW